MATWRVIEWRGLRLDFDRGLNREFHGSRIELQEGIIMDFKKFITDLAAIYRMPTARTPVGPIVDVDAVHEVGRKAGHEAGHAEGYEAGYNKVWGTATSFPCSWAFLARARIIPKLRRCMHAEVGAVMIGLSRLGFKTLIVACAIASVAFPQAGFAQQPATPPVTKTTVTAAPVVFAAASMETALDAIAGSWAAQSGRSPSIVYASSAALAKQIEQGAPADIFISADTNWMDYLDNKKLIQPGTRHDLLGNTLVLIEPADSRVTLKIEPGFDLIGATGDSKIAVCIIESCPGGIYAKQALEKLGVEGRTEAGASRQCPRRLEPRLAWRSVRYCLRDRRKSPAQSESRRYIPRIDA